jgi:hypothetical protein
MAKQHEFRITIVQAFSTTQGVPRGSVCPLRLDHVNAKILPPGLRRPLDYRHGRVPIHMVEHDESRGYLVWDPAMGNLHDLSESDIKWLVYSAAVLCAVNGCDHLDCHRGPFRVVFAAIEDYMYMDFILASVFSSETSAWSVPDCQYAITSSQPSQIQCPAHAASGMCSTLLRTLA